MATIPPPLFEPVARAIGDRFSFSDLDIILFKCTGERRINDVANPLSPFWETARACLNEMERDGTVVPFLALLVDARRADDAFRNLLLQSVPQLAYALRDTSSLVKEAVDQLYRTHSHLGDPAVKAAVAKSRDTIRGVFESVGALEAYKNLHDSLHTIQIHRISGLHAAVLLMQTDQSQLDRLRDFHDVVRTAHETAQPWAGKLTGVPRNAEQSWIQKLVQAAESLQDALDKVDVPGGRAALADILRILELQPPRINELIVATAKQLPLQALETALSEVGDAGGQGDLKYAAASFRNLRVSLLSRVVEHGLWQDADERLWMIDRLFLNSTGDLIDAFGMDWSRAKNLVRALAENDPDAAWSKKARQYAAAVDDLTVLLDVTIGDGTAATLSKDQIQTLHRRYDDFRREARHRFFQVDKLLKENCAELAEIGMPLQSILGALESQ